MRRIAYSCRIIMGKNALNDERGHVLAANVLYAHEFTLNDEAGVKYTVCR